MHTSVARTPAWLEDDPRPLDWNGPIDRAFTRFPDETQDRSIIDRFASVARRHPDRSAIRDAATALTFGELWQGVSGLAETLAAESAPGDLVGILLPAAPLFPLAMLACLAAGRPFVALDTQYPRDWLDHALDDARPTLAHHSEIAREAPSGTSPREARHSPGGLPDAARECWQPARLGQDEPACVLFTSGSTAVQRGSSTASEHSCSAWLNPSTLRTSMPQTGS